MCSVNTTPSQITHRKSSEVYREADVEVNWLKREGPSSLLSLEPVPKHGRRGHSSTQRVTPFTYGTKGKEQQILMHFPVEDTGTS